MSLLSKKTKKRIEGVIGLAQTLAQENPVVHTLTTAKDVADSAYKIRNGKDPNYLRMLQPRQRKFMEERKYNIQPRNKYTEPRLSKYEEDPLKRAERQARLVGDYRLAREIRRLRA